jgi:predicted 3-demethylubiquinone-9 3-methyltransferase (glyoxalase superfamily)
MSTTITPFLMFQGQCEQALNLYVSLFPGATVPVFERWGPEGPGAEGQVARATFVLGDREFRAFDSPPVHAFGFTASFSMFVDCQDEAEIDRLWAALSDGGVPMMPLGNYGFARKFGWTTDRFGVSWQLSLA